MSFRASILTALTVLLVADLGAQSQSPELIGGRNVNMAGGAQILSMSPYEVRGDVLGRAQNEPSCAISTRNPQHVLCGANDYRMVDVPGVTQTQLIRDAWLGVFQSADGGDTWQSTLYGGFFLDPAAHPLKTLRFQAAADPVVRSGPAGVAFYAGIAFTGDKSRSALHVSTYLDLNNSETDEMPFKTVRTTVVHQVRAPQFIDKPWMYVEAGPDGQTCSLPVPGLPNQVVPASIVHVAYTVFLDAADSTAAIMYTRSNNCGLNFSTPLRLNPIAVASVGLNDHGNGAAIAKPLAANSQTVVTTWRRVRQTVNGSVIPDAILASVSTNNGQTWTTPFVVEQICPFDQGTSTTSFRTTAFPSLTADGTGRFYVAWTDRRQPDGTCSFSQSGSPIGAGRIRIATSTDGRQWSSSVAVPSSTPEHQIQPSLTFTAGRLFLAWVDFRNDASGVFGQFVNEAEVLVNSPAIRHTGDVRASMALPGPSPNFAQGVTQISEYLKGVYTVGGKRVVGQMQWNAVNRRWARKGTVPFYGDYIDIATRPYLPPDPVAGRTTWTPNNQATIATALGPVPVMPNLLVAWSDNRDMRAAPGVDHDPAVAVPYTTPAGLSLPTRSVYDPTQNRPVCTVPSEAYKTGTTNQNTYAARLSVGFVAAAPSNNKELGALQRAFVIFVRNDGTTTKSFRLITAPPPGGFASFDQFDSSRLILDVNVPRRSSVARTIYVSRDAASATPLSPNAPIKVDVVELVGATPVTAATVMINGDASAPEIESPEIESREVFTPEIESPEIESRGFASPEIESPEIESPEIESPEIESAIWRALGLGSPEIESPEIESPEIESPEIESPEIESPEINNAAITDARFRVTNRGNTTGQYNAKAFVTPTPGGDFRYQVIVRKTYSLPAVDAQCRPTTIQLSKVAVNLTDVQLGVPEIESPEIESPEIESSAPTTASFFLAPEETAEVIVRTRSARGLTLPAEAFDLAAQPDAVNSEEAVQGITEPPIVTTYLSIGTTALPAARNGVAYNTLLLASGGADPVAFSVVQGALPPGLILTSAGQIAGTPTVAGSYSFTLQAADASFPVQAVTRSFTIAVTTPGVATLAFITQPSGTLVGAPITPFPSVRAFTAAGAPAAGVNVTLQLTGAAGLGGTLTQTTGTNGVAVFDDLSVNALASGLGLNATAAGFAATTSTAFATVLPANSTLAFNVPPSNVAVGSVMTPAVEVRALDPSGASVPGISVSLQLVGTGSLTGTLTRITGGNGNAVFNDLVLATGGTGLALQAIATGYVTALSTTFDAVASTMHSPVADSGVTSEPLVARPVQGLGGDANRDLVVLHANGLVTSMSGNGTGQFNREFQSTIAGMTGAPRDLRVGNVDGDGVPDLVIAYDGANTNNLAIVSSNGTFGHASTTPVSIPGVPGAVVIGQFNAAVDPNPDVAMLSRTTNQLLLVGFTTNTPAVQAVPLPGTEPIAIAGGQMNPGTDPWIDLVVLNRGSRDVTVLLGNGAGGFTSAGSFPLGAPELRTPSDSPDALALADFNEDGILDVAVATDAAVGDEGQAVIVLTGTGTGALSGGIRHALSAGPFSLTTGDFNNDGHIDIATANPAENNVTILHGTGAGAFASPETKTGGNTPRGIAAGDFTNDGKPELVVANRLQRPQSLVDDVTTIVNSAAGNGALTVTSTGDSGPGSLREAIITANTRAGVDEVSFAIPGAGPHVVALSTELPQITDPIVIDGTTQPGYAGSPRVEIDGSGIGVDADGVWIANGYSDVTGLSLTGFLPGPTNVGGSAIVLAGPAGGSFVFGNYIGLHPSGLPVGAPTVGWGVTSGGPNAIGAFARRNVISGTSFTGVLMDGSGAIVMFNRFGTTPDGLASAMPGQPQGTGVTVRGSSIQVWRNLIANQGGVFITSNASNVLVQGNFIGTDATGTNVLATPSSNSVGVLVDGSSHLIGGNLQAEANVIGGYGTGVLTRFGSGVFILRNQIGLGADGVTNLPNQVWGIGLAGGGNFVHDNIITASSQAGVMLTGADAQDNLVSNNTIDQNPGVGIGLMTTAGSRNTLVPNVLTQNGSLAIDLNFGDGPTANDVGDTDAGPNDLQNFPVITGAVASGGNTIVSGFLNSTPASTFILNVFQNTGTCPAQGRGAGQALLGSFAVVTDANGTATFSVGLIGTVPAGAYLSATATDAAGSTSEFSSCFVVPVTPVLASLAFSVEPTNVVAGQTIAPPVAVLATDTTGLAVANVPVTLTLVGNGTLSGTLTRTTGVNGLAVFNDLSVNTAGTGATLQAAAAGFAASTSASFDVTVAALVVTNVADSGIGSLRQALIDANANPDSSTITFNIPGAGPHVIGIQSLLPSIAQTALIDGTTQPGYAGVPLVHVAAIAGGGGRGIQINAGNSTVRGLSITGFSGSGLAILSPAGGNVVEANHLGVTPAGTPSANVNGLSIVDSPNNRIGSSSGAGNVISGNAPSFGVRIMGAGSIGNIVIGNVIGLNPGGTAAVPNGAGVVVDTGASNNMIGGLTSTPGAGVGNVISGNGDGVSVAGAAGTLVQGNIIGLNPTGTTVIGNTASGVRTANAGVVVGGGVANARNIISGNQNGVLLSNSGSALASLIQGNYIGTDITGMLARGNTSAGISIGSAPRTVVGGSASAGNLISGNATGIHIFAISGQAIGGVYNALVQGNVIGLNAAGTAAIGNTSGIQINNGDNLIGGTAPLDPGLPGGGGTTSGNVISGNVTAIAIAAGANQNIVRGNTIGLNAAGTIAIGNSSGIALTGGATNNIVGGTTAAERNVITGNVDGVAIVGASTTGNQVLGNYIGLNRAGTAIVGTGTWGVFIDQGAVNNTIGGNVAGAGNVISGLSQGAIALSNGATGNRVWGNVIGRDASGINTLGNENGIVIQQGATSNTIGGQGAFEGNSITGSTQRGVSIQGASTGNAVIANAIFDNGGLGIDLAADGVTQNDANDADGGPNNFQNFPVITAATTSSVVGTLHSTPNGSFTVHVFVNNTCDPSGFGEGQSHTATFGVGTNATGDGSFSQSGLTIPQGQFVTATATDENGNTSEFSACVQVTDTVTPVVTVVATDATADEAGPDGGSFTFTRTGPTTSPLNVNFSVGGTATPVVEYSNTLGIIVTIPADQSSATISFTPVLDGLVEDDETVVITLTPGDYTIGDPSTATVTITENTPTVTVVAADPAASESGPDAGAFTFTRTGPTVAALNVSFTLGGTATADVDFINTIGTLITIPAGQPSATVIFTPTPDALFEGPETVTVTLVPGTYIIGNPNAASAVIADANAPVVTTFSVTNTNDSGPESLRQAILDANTFGTVTDLIVFNIPGLGVHTISPTSPLPAITQPVIMNATTQPGFAGTPVIELSGAQAGAAADGLVISAGNSFVGGFAVNRWSGRGVFIHTGHNNTITSNYIGTDPTGTIDLGNGGVGAVHIVDSAGNFIGSNTIDLGNLISGNELNGIRVDGALAQSNFISFNRIGTTASNAPLGNASAGVYIRHAPNTQINGNVVRYNGGGGAISVCGDITTCPGPVFGTEGNRASTTTIFNNVITDNTGAGVWINGAPNTQVGAVGNGNNISNNGSGGTGSLSGVVISGVGATANQIAGNAINGNAHTGILIVGAGNTGNRIQGNTFINNGGLAIDLGVTNSIALTGADGVTPNDAGDGDVGPNNYQNFPIITQAFSTGVVQGTLNSTANSGFILEFFGSNTCDASGVDAQRILGSGGVLTDGSGNTAFAINLTSAPAVGEWVTATASSSAGNTSEFSACFQATDDTTPVVTVVAADPTADEAGPDGGSFTFTRTGPTTAPLNVTFTLGGTATTDVDYANTIGTLVTIPAGQASATVNFTPILDALVEDNESVVITLTAGTYVIGTPSTATAIIAENTPTVTVVASDATASEAGLDSGAFTFTRGGPTVAPLNVQFTLGGTATVDVDYPNTIGTLVTIPSGQSSAIVTFTPSPDALVEVPETVTVTITAGTYVIGASNTATATITDTTLPVVELSLNLSDSPDPVLAGQNVTYTFSVTNNGTLPATNVTLLGGFGAGLTFVSATGGCVFGVPCSMGTIAPGATSSIDVTMRADETGDITVSGSVSADEADVNPANNGDIETTTVTPNVGQITGIVRSAGGAPLAGVNVQIVDPLGDVVHNTTTAADGTFLTEELAVSLVPGVALPYYVRVVNVAGHVNATYGCPTVSCGAQFGTPINLAGSGATTNGIDFNLIALGSISGTASTSTGTPQVGSTILVVNADDATSNFPLVASTSTAANGTYTVSLAPGRYYVRSLGGPVLNGTISTPQFYSGINCVGCLPSDGTIVLVTSGSQTSGVNFTHQAGGGRITGTITDASTGSPLSGVTVLIFTGTGETVQTLNTNASGLYESTGLPNGQYFVKTANRSSSGVGPAFNFPYIDELYGNFACPFGCAITTGTAVSVAGTNVTGIDIALSLGGQITGTVLDATNGESPSAQVQIFRSNGQFATTASTDGSGTYFSTGLPNGTYYVRASASSEDPFIDALYGGQPCLLTGGGTPTCDVTSGTPVVIAGGANATGINFALNYGGLISGRVTNEATGAPLPSISQTGNYRGTRAAVSIFNSAGQLIMQAPTDQDGRYLTPRALPPGSYYARTLTFGVTIDEAYGNVPCLGEVCDVLSSTPIVVTAVVTESDFIKSGIDFALAVGGSIESAIVSAATGAPASATLAVYDASGQLVSNSSLFATAGVAASRGLPPGNYFARTIDTPGTLLQPFSVSGSVVHEVYDNVTCLPGCSVTTGTPIALTANTTTPITLAVNRSLGRIMGYVTEASNGALLSAVPVEIYNAAGALVTTVLSRNLGPGYFASPGLAAGTYYLRTRNALGYPDVVYNGQPCVGECNVTLGTPVTVTNGQPTAGIVLALGIAPQPVISISSFDESAAETGPDAGTFTVTSSSTNGLVVHYTVSGTAANGVDYTALPGSVTIPVGQASVTFSVNPIDDAFAEPAETVVVTLSADPAYLIGTSSLATVTIAPDGGDTALVVSNTNNSGPGSLRQALLDANASPDASTIMFAIPGPGPYTIQPTSALPTVTAPVVIDGTTQPGFSGTPIVELSGQLAPPTTAGLTISASGITVRGLVINRFDGAGLRINGPGGNLVEGNFIGTNAAGTAALGNTYGVQINSSSTNAVLNNVMSGNNQGIRIEAATGLTSTGNVIRGNRIGTDRTGTTGIGNAIGIWILNDGSSTNSIGGLSPADGNIIAFNSGIGVHVLNAGSINNRIQSNSIFSNGGLGIDLSTTGVLVNDRGDGDTGTNNQQNHPLVIATSATGVSGSLNSTPNTLFSVQLFSNATCDNSSSYGEGQTLLATLNVLTDAGGNAAFSQSGLTLTAGQEVTATATDPSGNTSEFSPCSFVSATAGAMLSFVSQPTTTFAGQVIAPPVTVFATGPSALPVAGVPVTLLLIGGGNLSGTLTRTTGASGLAVFDNISIDTIGNGRSLEAVATGYFSASSFPFNTVANTGQIAGSVTSAITGPLSGASVQISDRFGTIVATVTTAANGTFLTGSLPGSTYYARTNNVAGHLNITYGCPTVACNVQFGTPITVGGGTTAGNVNFTLASLGAISGTAASTTGVPRANSQIQVFNADNVSFNVTGAVATVNTAADGTYNIPLAPGRYYVRSSGNGLIPQVYGGGPTCVGCLITDGSVVTVTAGTTTSAINFSHQAGGQITGTITNAVSAAPISGVTVQLYTATGEVVGNGFGTNASGTYFTAGLVDGQYFLKTFNTLGYIDELYGDFACPFGCAITTGTPITITGGATVTDVNIALSTGGRITGTVTDATTGGAINSGQVLVYRSNGQLVSTTTLSGGTYTSLALADGSYFVRVNVSSPGYIDQLYAGQTCLATQTVFGPAACDVTTGTPVPIAGGANTAGINFALSRGGTVSGRITNELTAAGLASVSQAGDGNFLALAGIYTASGQFVGQATTDQDGRYVFSKGLPTGSYLAKSFTSGLTIDEMYGGAACLGDTCNVLSGTPFSVTAPTSTSGIDFALAVGGSIKATLTDAATGVPIVATVGIYNETGQLVSTPGLSISGIAMGRGLPPGTYFVKTVETGLQPFSASGNVVHELYDNLPCPPGCAVSGGTPIVLTANTTTPLTIGLNRALGRIMGYVTEASTGALLSDVPVEIYNAAGALVTTVNSRNANEGYFATTGLPAGTYYLRTRNTVGFPDVLYNGQPCIGECNVTLGTPVVVTAGQPTAGIVLALGGILQPVVTIAATDIFADEVTGDPAMFTVTRQGNTADPLVVHYAVGGTATADIDYLALPGSITIPAGQASATFLVEPLDDTLIEAVETVLVSLTPDATYTLGIPAEATVVIQEDVTDTLLEITNTNDSGPGSLRQAIIDGNAAPDLNIVIFSIPGTGPFTIQPTSPLPAVTSPIYLIATTQPGFTGTPIVELSGASAGADADGLVFSGGGSAVTGLAINRWSGRGIYIHTGGGNVLTSNYIGTDITGTVDLGNAGLAGIHIVDSSGNFVGGGTVDTGNLISGNDANGVRIDGALATSNVVFYNRIGSTPAGAALGNGIAGIYVRRAHGMQISGNNIQFNVTGINICGDPTTCPGPAFGTEGSNASSSIIFTNVISNQSGMGIVINGAPSTLVGVIGGGENTISNNGFGAPGPARGGVLIGGVGATDNQINGNTISGNNLRGVLIVGSGNIRNRVQNNTFIGNVGPAIDLGSTTATDFNDGNGATPNDPGDGDVGPNTYQNFPVLTQALASGAVQGTLNSLPNGTYTLDFYASATCNVAGPDAQRVLGSTFIATDTDGNATFNLTLTSAPLVGEFVTATATDLSGNTSELSSCVTTGSASALLNGVNHTGSISTPGEIDLWTFTATAGATIALSIGETGTNSAFWPWIRLLSPTGAQLAGESGDLVGQITISAPSTGTYTVQVASNDSGNNDIGNYVLIMTTTPGTFTVPADDQGGALTNGGNHAGAIFIGDLDLWTFTATAGDSIALSISQTGGDAIFWPWIRLISPTGVIVTSSSGDLVGQITVTAGATGTYTVLVASNDSFHDAIGAYSLTLARTPAAFAVPPGDNGGALTNGDNHAGAITIGDLDLWTFTATTGDSIALSISQTGGDPILWPWIRLISPTGVIVTSSSGDLVGQITVTAGATGTYTVLVASNDSFHDADGTYSLTLAQTPGAFVVPPGDNGGALTNGDNHAGAITIGDLDLWTFTATAGDSIALSISQTGGDPVVWPWIRLISPAGVIVTSSSGDLVGQITVTAGATGTYTVLVASNDSFHDAAGTYSLTLAHTPGAFVVPPGDDGGALAVGVNQAGSISIGDLDLWTFTVTAGSSISLNISQTGGDPVFWPWIRLISPTGVVLTNTSGDLAAQINTTAGVTGTYTVLVGSNDSGNDAAGDYVLTLN